MHRPVRARTLYFQMILLFLHSDGIQTLAHAGVVSVLDSFWACLVFRLMTGQLERRSYPTQLPSCLTTETSLNKNMWIQHQWFPSCVPTLRQTSRGFLWRQVQLMLDMSLLAAYTDSLTMTSSSTGPSRASATGSDS